MEKSRLELLLEAASCANASCANGCRQCKAMYENILAVQNIDSVYFRHLVFEALKHGRRKGNAVMLVGGKDTGKTTITEPLNSIFHCMHTPQSDSFCPLEGCRGHEVFLWQDFRYNPGHPNQKEQGMRLDEGTWNRFLEGLPTRIGVPKTDGCRADFVYTEDAALIFTGPYKMTAYRHGCPDVKETEQIDIRVTYVEFLMPAPPFRDRSFKHCALCWSQWILEGELAWVRSHQVSLDSFMEKVVAAMGAHGNASSVPMAGPAQSANAAPAAATPPQPASGSKGPGFVERLQHLIEWRAAGLLSEEEFAAAKRQLLGL